MSDTLYELYDSLTDKIVCTAHSIETLARKMNADTDVEIERFKWSYTQQVHILNNRFIVRKRDNNGRI